MKLNLGHDTAHYSASKLSSTQTIMADRHKLSVVWHLRRKVRMNTIFLTPPAFDAPTRGNPIRILLTFLASEN